MPEITLLHGDCTEVLVGLPSASIDCCVTSPPYWLLRQYRGGEREIGQEVTWSDYLIALVRVFREVRRVLVATGTLWLVVGDAFAGAGYSNHNRTVCAGQGRFAGRTRHLKVGGLPRKSLIGLPWELARTLQHDGWLLRRDIIWHKPNAMPDPVADRPWTEHEYIFLLAKQPDYYYAPTIPREYRGSIWSIPRSAEDAGHAHTAVFPVALAAAAVHLGCPPDGTVLDPFSGSGTTGVAALRAGRAYVGVELNLDYHIAALARLNAEQQRLSAQLTLL